MLLSIRGSGAHSLYPSARRVTAILQPNGWTMADVGGISLVGFTRTRPQTAFDSQSMSRATSRGSLRPLDSSPKAMSESAIADESNGSSRFYHAITLFG